MATMKMLYEAKTGLRVSELTDVEGFETIEGGGVKVTVPGNRTVTLAGVSDEQSGKLGVTLREERGGKAIADFTVRKGEGVGFDLLFRKDPPSGLRGNGRVAYPGLELRFERVDVGLLVTVTTLEVAETVQRPAPAPTKQPPRPFAPPASRVAPRPAAVVVAPPPSEPEEPFESEGTGSGPDEWGLDDDAEAAGPGEETAELDLGDDLLGDGDEGAPDATRVADETPPPAPAPAPAAPAAEARPPRSGRDRMLAGPSPQQANGGAPSLPDPGSTNPGQRRRRPPILSISGGKK